MRINSPNARLDFSLFLSTMNITEKYHRPLVVSGDSEERYDDTKSADERYFPAGGNRGFGKRVAYRPIYQDDNGSFNMIQVGNIIDEYRSNPALLEHILVYDDGIVKGMINWKDCPNGGTTDEIELYCFYVEPFLRGRESGGCC